MATLNDALIHLSKNPDAIKLKRTLTSITPIRATTPFIEDRSTIRDMQQGKITRFLNGGIQSVLDSKETIAEALKTVSMFNYSRESCISFDAFNVLYTALTLKDKSVYYDYELERQGQNIVAVDIVTSRKALMNGVCAVLMDGNGRVRRDLPDAEAVVKKIRDLLYPMLDPKKGAPMPAAYARLKLDDGQECVVSGFPLQLLRDIKTGSNDALMLRLDLDFAPFKIGDDGQTLGNAGDQYVPTIAGLTSFLMLGQRLTYAQDPALPKLDIAQIMRIILTLQVGKAFQNRFLGMDFTGLNGRDNVIIRRKAIGSDLAPQAVAVTRQGKDYINYKKAIAVVSAAGKIYGNAIERTGIIQELSSSEKQKIFLPAAEHSIEFPEDNEKIAKLKVDPLC